MTILKHGCHLIQVRRAPPRERHGAPGNSHNPRSKQSAIGVGLLRPLAAAGRRGSVVSLVQQPSGWDRRDGHREGRPAAVLLGGGKDPRR